MKLLLLNHLRILMVVDSIHGILINDATALDLILI